MVHALNISKCRGAMRGTAVVWLMVGAGPVGAQSQGAATGVEPGAVLLDTISITAAGSTTEGSESYVAVGPSASATGLPLSAREVPQSVSAQTQQLIRDRGDVALQDTLEQTAGMSVSQSNGEGRWRFYARGSEVTNLQFDGIPVRSAWWGQESNPNSMVLYDRVEVTRGATGLLEGAGTPSASINMLRKRPLTETEFSTATTLASEGNASLTLDGSAPLNAAGTARGRLIGYGLAGDTARDDQTSNTGLLYGALDFDLGEATTLGVGLSYQKDRSEPYSWGGLWTRMDGRFFDFDGRDQPGLSWEYMERTQTVAYADLEHRLDNGWVLRLAGRASWADADRLSSYAKWDAEGVLTRAGDLYDMEEDTYGVVGSATGTVAAFGRVHDLTFGVTANQTKANYFAPGNYAILVADPSRADPFEAPRPALSTDQVRSNDETIKQWGIYANARLDISDPFKVIAGGRLSWYDYRDLSIGYTDVYRFDNSYNVDGQFTPYLGATYDLNENWTVYASYTGIFDPQSAAGANGGLLPPVTGTNAEVGVKADFLGGALTASAALFTTSRDGLGVPVADVSQCVSAPDICYEAAERIDTKGGEITVAGAVTDRWNVAASYTYQKSDYAEGPNEGMRYATDTVPEQLAKLTTSYRMGGALEGLVVGGAVSAQSRLSAKGDYWANGLPFEIIQPGYAVVDLMARYALAERTEAQVNVTNLFDRTYYSSISDPGYGNWIGAPRGVSVTLRHVF